MPIIDGKKIAQELESELQNELKDAGLTPTLAILQVGDDAASTLYIQKKQEAAERIGAHALVTKLPATTPDQELIKQIQQWNDNQHVQGILVQLPLQGEHDTTKITATISPKKDVDAFHPETTTIISPVHEAVLRSINTTNIKLAGALVYLITKSDVFTEPLMKLLKLAGCIVTQSTAEDLNTDRLKQADIVVIAIGRAHFLHPTLTSPNAIIIDIGINKEQGKTVGDAETTAFLEAGHFITPVPGGIGPITVACALKNLVRLTIAKTLESS